MLATVTLGLVLAPATVAPQTSSSASPVSIYVGPFVRDELVDAYEGVSDSVKDIKKRLLKERQFRLVSDAESADLALYVVLRGTATVAGERSTVHYPGTVVRFPNGQAVQTPGMRVKGETQLRHVGALLRVGEYERPFVAETDWAWERCADQIVQDLTAWLQANRERLKAGSLKPDASTYEGENLYGLRFDPRGADFTEWVSDFKNQVHRNWNVPQAAYLGYGGHADFEFTIEKDGSMSKLRMLKSSGTPALDRAARNALAASRFIPLPDDYGSERIRMQVAFHYGPDR